MAPPAPQKDQSTRPTSAAAKAVTSKPALSYTLIVRLPFPRGDFVDPPPVSWDAAKDRKLWKLISRTGAKAPAASEASSTSASEAGNTSAGEVDWETKAAEFGVDTTFLLQQAAWLYERHLQQVKRQVGRLRAGSTTASPIPGQTSLIARRTALNMPSSRAPSSLSIRSRDSPLPKVDTSLPNTASRPSALSRTPSTATVTQSRHFPPTLQQAPASPHQRSVRPASIRSNPPTASTIRDTRQDDSPGPPSSSESDSSDSSADIARMSRSHAAFRRPPRFGPKKPAVLAPPQGSEADEDDDDDSEPTFIAHPPHSTQDMGATLRMDPSRRPHQPERVMPDSSHAASTASPPPHQQQLSRPSRIPTPTRNQTESSASSLSSATTAPSAQRRTAHPLSPRHRQELARLTSPRRATGEISDGTPSMGSSFSDLDGMKPAS